MRKAVSTSRVGFTSITRAPTDLTAAAESSSQINLAWDAVASATAYEVERSVDGSTGWQQIGVTAGSTWFYRVRAINTAGDSDYSDPAGATTLGGGGAALPRRTSGSATTPLGEEPVMALAHARHTARPAVDVWLVMASAIAMVKGSGSDGLLN